MVLQLYHIYLFKWFSLGIIKLNVRSKDICNNCLFEFYILHIKDAQTMDTILAHFCFFLIVFFFIFKKYVVKLLLFIVVMILFVLLCTWRKIDQR